MGTVVAFGRLKCSVCRLEEVLLYFSRTKIMVVVVVMMMMSNFVSCFFFFLLFFQHFHPINSR